MKKTHLSKCIGANWGVIVLLIVFISICITNIYWGKQLIGWDAINPELHFSLNLKRVFSSFWQENQGVGLLGGHGFASTLPHTILIWMLSLFLPEIYLRTVFTFGCYLIGGIGIYILLKVIIPSAQAEKRHLAFMREGAIVAGSLYYWFSLGTIQMFHIQLEAFIVHFGGLPWLFLSVVQILRNKTRSSLLIFFFINLIFSTQGFVPPLFVAYAISLLLMLIVYIALSRNKKSALLTSLLVLFLTFVSNIYWITPLAYYTLTKSSIYLNSFNNIISTPEFIGKNSSYGDIFNVPLIKGYMFEAVDRFAGGKPIYIFQSWINHLNLVTEVIGYSLFAFSVLGIIFSIGMWRINPYLILFVPVYLFFFTGITTNFPPFSYITELLQTHMPVYRQAFRAAFTKFSLGLSFSYSMYLAIGLYALSTYLSRWVCYRKLLRVMSVLIIVSVIYFGLPVFKHGFFYKRLEVTVPDEYKELISYFKTQPDGRIADLPQDCPEGWFTYNWGYTGSGFYWYGIKQPIMARTFDVWSNYNENYYWELQNALRMGNPQYFESVMDKYDIQWVIYDPTILHCKSVDGFSQNKSIHEYIQNSTGYTEILFSQQKMSPRQQLRLYKRNKNVTNAFVSLENHLPNIMPEYQWTDNDNGYRQHGSYISSNLLPINSYYPMRTFFTKRGIDSERTFDVTINTDTIIFSTKLRIDKKSVGTHYLSVPNPLSTDKKIFAKIRFDNNNIQMILSIPSVYIDSRQITPDSISIPLARVQLGNDRTNGYHIFLNGEKMIYDAINTEYVGLAYSSIKNNIQIIDALSNKSVYQGDIDIQKSYSEKKYPIYLTESSELQIRSQHVSLPGQNFSSEQSLLVTRPRPCNELHPSFKNYFFLTRNEDVGTYLSMRSTDGRQCVTYMFPEYEANNGYLVSIQARKLQGSNPALYMINGINQRLVDVSVQLEDQFKKQYFIIPPDNSQSRGVSINLENFSYDNTTTINELSEIDLFLIPYNYITSISFSPQEDTSQAEPPESNPVLNVSHPIETHYFINLSRREIDRYQYLTLSQGFDSGWVAYAVPSNSLIDRWFPFVNGKKIAKHYLANNWKNAWFIEEARSQHENLNISIVYLPQYAQYASFLILLLILGCISVIKWTKNQR